MLWKTIKEAIFMNIENRVLNVIKENTDKDIKIAKDTSFADLSLDSFDRMMIVAGLEEEFSINIDIDDFSKYKKIIDIITDLKKLYEKDKNTINLKNGE
jgi:acyl carrier protein